MAVLLLLFVARIVVTRTIAITRTPLDIPILAFIASAAISTLFAENVNVGFFGTYARYDGLLTFSIYASLFWLSLQSLAGADDARAVIRALLASGYVVAAVAIIQSIHDVGPAFGSLGNPNVLGAFLALVFAISAGEVFVTRSTAGRILLFNLLIVTGLALLLTFSRSAWVGAVVGLVAVVASRLRRAAVLAPLVVVAVIAVAIVPGLGARMRTLFDLAALTGSRLGIWRDSLHLIASRPILGYGPDNVGLVFPRFQTGDWGLAAGHLRQPIDKAHLDVLQVAATQGVVGVVAYAVLLGAFAWCFWRARRDEAMLPLLAGWVAYQVVVQLNFSALASALPFWIFAAAAMVSLRLTRTHTMALRNRGVSLATAASLAIAVFGCVLPCLADISLRQAVDADYSGHPRDAQVMAADARRLGPQESVYAVEVANLAFELNQWAAARTAYRDAAALGTFNPLVYRNLALADRNLGLTTEAREAARKAVELDPYDPANQALLAEFGGSP